MRITFFACLLFVLKSPVNAQPLITLFESSSGTESPTYQETINWWKKLAANSKMVTIKEFGNTDAGFPLHLIMIGHGDKKIASIRTAKKSIILVNNGIHPGEPDGIDASMLLARDIIQNKYRLPANVVLAIIPIYNIGGALNRSKFYRIDQNGPVEKGFRGNAQNLDLNRDFIKADSRNAFAFAEIFHYLEPEVFIDNHVSNGADYQHVMTLLTTQHNKLGGRMGNYINTVFEPSLYRQMAKKGYDLIPYVNHFGDTPDKGWPEYWDGPRYSSGYATLFNSFAFVPETHMLKPYKQRVAATRALMESFIEFVSVNNNDIQKIISESRKELMKQNSFPLHYKLDRTIAKTITYKGYESGYKKSEISGLNRLYYDRTKPFEKQIPFYNFYRDSFSVTAPQAYIIPQGWWKVIDRLRANKVDMKRLMKDTIIEVEVYKIKSYQSSQRPYEGHHINSNVQVTKSTQTISFRKGDYLIPLHQRAKRFIIETLEPQADDSYFAWNFFDPILGQKEGFSHYVFEETALAYLNDHPSLKDKLEQRKASDTTFAKNGRAQLNFIYENSPYYEPAYMRYPVYRLMK